MTHVLAPFERGSNPVTTALLTPHTQASVLRNFDFLSIKLQRSPLKYSNMPLEVHRITSPDDLETFARIQILAFASGGGIASLLSHGPMTEEHVKKYTERHVKSWRDEKDVFYLKVVDTDVDGGKMIAGAKWRISEKEKTEEEAQKMYPTPEGDDLNNQALVDFMAFLNRARKQYVNTKPICCKSASIASPRETTYANPNQSYKSW